MTAQTKLNITEGRERRDEGMLRAETTANSIHENWSEIALDFLKGYAERNAKFMIEDCRFASQGIVPLPPSNRSWGSITFKAIKAGWIHNRNHEFAPVKNGRAHKANAAVWKSLIFRKHLK